MRRSRHLLAALPVVIVAALAGSGSAATAAPPQATRPPAVTGGTEVGGLLRASVGRWQAFRPFLGPLLQRLM